MLNFNKNIKIGNRMIGPDYPTYFIAEIGGNFDGSLDKAKRLIDAAKEAGADCAKFQTFKAERCAWLMGSYCHRSVPGRGVSHRVAPGGG